MDRHDLQEAVRESLREALAKWEIPYLRGAEESTKWNRFYTDTMTGWRDAERDGNTYNGRPKAYVLVRHDTSGSEVVVGYYGLFVWDESTGKHKLKKKDRDLIALLKQARRINSARSKSKREEARSKIVALVTKKGVVRGPASELGIRGATAGDLASLVKKGILTMTVSRTNVPTVSGPFAGGGSRVLKSASYRLA